ncbi:hypothetical protein BD289DRAFT_423185 [Coniella lustricola]|uniref:Secreted protein n=1 Tax=Coniella lustricola TaxID=2025994 RepID=A0A2T3AKA1_9PEZI|nr:hypothetical protein BD289DRAFT_423185 [Coniella lustricola]
MTCMMMHVLAFPLCFPSLLPCNCLEVHCARVCTCRGSPEKCCSRTIHASHNHNLNRNHPCGSPAAGRGTGGTKKHSTREDKSTANKG